MAKVVYASNGGVIGDGIRITRVSNGGQKLEVMVDPKAERWSEVVLASDETAPVDPPPVEPDPDPVPPSDVTAPVVQIKRVGTDLIVYAATEPGTAFWLVNDRPGALTGPFIASSGNAFPVARTGTAEQTLDLSGLARGVHYMHLTVRDAAGNFSIDVPQVFETAG